MNDLTEQEEILAASSKILAGYVVVYRLLKIYRERSEACMIELMNRRANGDDFNFEEYIENELKEAPKPNDLNKISQILKVNLK
jgi:hypothetical protein